jgi:hypothetical protein
MKLKFLFVVFAATVLAYVGGYAQPGLVFRDDAETLPVIPCEWCTSKYDGWSVFTGGNQQINNQSPTHTLKVLAQGDQGAPAPRNGTKSFQFKITRMPEYFGTCCQWTRAELMWGGCCQFTNSQWFLVSTYLPSDYCEQDDIPTQIAYDMKFTDAQGPASMSLWVQNGRYVIQQLSNQHSSSPSTDVKYSIPGTMGVIQKGIWVDWVVHRNFKDDATGFLKVYAKRVGIDAAMVRVYNHTGPNYNMQQGPNTEAYLNHGLYRWAWQNAVNQNEGDGTPIACANDPKVIYLDQIIMLDATVDSAQVAAILAGGTTPGNVSPTAQAGGNQTIVLPDTDAALDGSSFDSDGFIEGFAWTQISGPNTATMSNSGVEDQTVSNLIQGTYVFRLTVTDNDGASSTDDIQIQVQPSTPPATATPIFTDVACTEAVGESNCTNVGTPNQTIQLPITGDTVIARAVHQNNGGYIQSFGMVQLSGPVSATINQFDQSGWIPTQTHFGVTGMSSEGVYVFEITATDNDGTPAKDTMSITVVELENVGPTVNAGSDQAIGLDGFGAFPIKSTQLIGTATDADGSVASLQWIQYSGPENALISTPTNDSTTVGGLIGGSYVFRLLATDNDGVITHDDVAVDVYYVEVGSDTVIILPNNSMTMLAVPLISTGINSVLWEKIGGPTGGNLSSTSTLGTTVSAIEAGIYSYQVTVTYANGIIVKDRKYINAVQGGGDSIYKIKF